MTVSGCLCVEVGVLVGVFEPVCLCVNFRFRLHEYPFPLAETTHLDPSAIRVQK